MEREWGEAFAQAKAFLSKARQPEVKPPEVSKFECLNAGLEIKKNPQVAFWRPTREI